VENENLIDRRKTDMKKKKEENKKTRKRWSKSRRGRR
jgi:hypothetical protein